MKRAASSSNGRAAGPSTPTTGRAPKRATTRSARAPEPAAAPRPAARSPKASATTEPLPAVELPPDLGPNFDLAAFLARQGLEVIDKRAAGGVLWLVEGAQRSPLIDALRARGISLTFAANGGRATAHRPAWFTRWGAPEPAPTAR